MGIHYLYPAITFICFIVASAVSVCTLQTLKASIDPKNQRIPRQTILNGLLLVVVTYLAQLTTVVIRSIVSRNWFGREDVVVGWLSCFMVYGVQSAMLAKTEHPVWYPFYGSWLFAVACESTLGILYFLRGGGFLSGLPSVAHFGLCALRASLFLLIAILSVSRRERASIQSSDEERQSLLNSNGSTQQPEESGTASTTTAQNGNQDYGSTQASDTATKKRRDELSYERREREGRERREKQLLEEGNWFTYVRKFLVSPTMEREGHSIHIQRLLGTD